MPYSPPLLQLKNIYLNNKKSHVLQNISFDLKPGEIHALVGEHRAGKTPLIKIITGVLKPDSGTYLLKGRLIEEMNTELALQKGIGVIYQEPLIIPNVSAFENIIAGTLPPGRISHKYKLEQIGRCRAILEEIGLDVNLETPMELLSAAQQQMIELARLYYLDFEILILDDISGRLTAKEMGLLTNVLKKSRNEGKSIIFIDSDVDNIIELADRVTFLHNGISGGTEDVKDLDRIKLLRLTYNFALNQNEQTDQSLILGDHGLPRNLMANLPAGVLIFNRDLELTSINNAANRILERETAPPSGTPAQEILLKEDLTWAEKIIDVLKNNEEKSWEHIPFQQKKFLRIKTMPFKDSSDTYKGSVLMLEEELMESSLREYLVRAEKISSVAELAAGVSHEINNPLGIINNYLQILLYGNPDDETREKLEKIQTQLSRITEITSSLLSFSKLKQVPDQSFNLIDLLDEVLLLLSHNIKNKNIQLSRTYPKGQIILKGNENRLRQVFVNLINNSIEAVAQGGHIKVEINREILDNYIQILISDDGYGIPLEIQKEIFSPFFSTKIKKENAGLGLSICQHIMEAHNGILTFSSTPGKNTTFKVKLPLV
ncbi:MAG: ATP-binding protein [Spirochaetales bacterium]|nr:ATP-binding protein [Spirochaetales bacterium]